MATKLDLERFIEAANSQLAFMQEQSNASIEAKTILLTRMAQVRAEIQSAQYMLDNQLYDVVQYKPRQQFIQELLDARRLDRLAAESAWQDRYEQGFTSL
jgi:hypothetical protein